MLNVVAHWLLLFTVSVSGSCVTLLRFVYPTSRVYLHTVKVIQIGIITNLENSVLYLFTMSLQVFILSFLAAEG